MSIRRTTQPRASGPLGSASRAAYDLGTRSLLDYLALFERLI